MHFFISVLLAFSQKQLYVSIIGIRLIYVHVIIFCFHNFIEKDTFCGTSKSPKLSECEFWKVFRK